MNACPAADDEASEVPTGGAAAGGRRLEPANPESVTAESVGGLGAASVTEGEEVRGIGGGGMGSGAGPGQKFRSPSLLTYTLPGTTKRAISHVECLLLVRTRSTAVTVPSSILTFARLPYVLAHSTGDRTCLAFACTVTPTTRRGSGAIVAHGRRSGRSRVGRERQ